MNNRNIIRFKPLSIEDSAIIHQWLQLDHVKMFWDDGDRTIEQVKTHYFKDDITKRYLFFINDIPVGYIQFYSINSNQEYAKFSLPNKMTIGIDFFIGNIAFLNKGLSQNILKEFINNFCDEVDRIIVDPECANLKAIHIYKKYGFTKVGQINNKLNDIMAINIRRTSRAIILNERQEILLMKIQSNMIKSAKRGQFSPFWVTLGGKIEKKETAESALKRELQEEAGVTGYTHPLLAAKGEQVLIWDDFPTRLIEKFYVVHIKNNVCISNANLTPEEKSIVKEYKWWTIEDLVSTKDIFYPSCLTGLIRRYLNSPIDWVAEEINLG